ncbi:unnamed protein product [Ixodes hexagonus]
MHQPSSRSEDTFSSPAPGATKSRRLPNAMSSLSRFSLSRRDVILTVLFVSGASALIVILAVALHERHRPDPLPAFLDLKPPRENPWQTRHIPLYFECESAACRATGDDLRKNVAWSLNPCNNFYDYVCSSDRKRTNVYGHAVDHYLREIRGLMDKYLNLGWFSKTPLSSKITKFFGACTCKSADHSLSSWTDQLREVWKLLQLNAKGTTSERMLADFSRAFHTFPIVQVSVSSASAKTCVVLTRPRDRGVDKIFPVPNVFSHDFKQFVQTLLGVSSSNVKAHSESTRLINDTIHVETLIQEYSGPRGEEYHPIKDYGDVPLSDMANHSKAFSWTNYLRRFLGGAVKVKKDSCVIARSPSYVRHVKSILPQVTTGQMRSFLKVRTAMALMAFRKLVSAKTKNETEKLCTLATYKLYRYAFLRDLNDTSLLQVYVSAGEKEVIVRMSYRGILTDNGPVTETHKNVDLAMKKANTEYFHLMKNVDGYYAHDTASYFDRKKLALSFVHAQLAMTIPWLRKVISSGGKVQDNQLNIRWDFNPDTEVLAVPVSIAPVRLKGEKEFFLESTTLGGAMVRFLYEAFHESSLFASSRAPDGRYRKGTPGACFEKQYGSLSVNQTKVNGRRVLRTVASDNALVPVLHKAFKTSLYIHKIEVINYKKLEMSLANLPDVDADQLFFLMLGQTFCDPHEDTAKVLKHAPFPPANIRLNTALANYPDFAKAFKCKNGTAMNPKKRCSAFRSK